MPNKCNSNKGRQTKIGVGTRPARVELGELMKKLYHSLLVSQLLMCACSSKPPKRFQNVEDEPFVRDEIEELYEEYDADFDVTQEYNPRDWEYDFYEFKN